VASLSRSCNDKEVLLLLLRLRLRLCHRPPLSLARSCLLLRSRFLTLYPTHTPTRIHPPPQHTHTRMARSRSRARRMCALSCRCRVRNLLKPCSVTPSSSYRCIYPHLQLLNDVYAHTHVYVCVYSIFNSNKQYICMCVCVCVCVCVYFYTRTHTHTLCIGIHTRRCVQGRDLVSSARGCTFPRVKRSELLAGQIPMYPSLCTGYFGQGDACRNP
jgi:hypothetical protein